MFSRNRSAAEPTPPPVAHGDAPGSKGRPTPTRKEAEAARKRPLVPADRKVAARSQRAASKEARDREYQALQSGDERFLPYRDKGPVKRWIRDYVDARRNLGEYFLPVSLLMVFSMFLTQQNAAVAAVVIGVMYLIVLATFADGFILSRKLKKRLEARFGAGNIPRGSLMYGVMRAFQIRRTRLPRPQVARGEHPA